MLVEGRIGESRGVTGVLEEARLGSYREVIVNDIGLGKYFEVTRLGRVFSLSSAAAVAALAAANASPLAANTGQPLVGILNPVGSGRAAVVLSAAVILQQNTITTPLPTIPVWNFIPNPTSITATGGAGAVRCDLQSTVSSSVMRTFVNTALTASVVATMLRLMNATGSPFALVNTTNAANQVATLFSEDVAGSLIVTPGAFLGIASGTSTATASFSASMTWAEVDWPL